MIQSLLLLFVNTITIFTFYPLFSYSTIFSFLFWNHSSLSFSEVSFILFFLFLPYCKILDTLPLSPPYGYGVSYDVYHNTLSRSNLLSTNFVCVFCITTLIFSSSPLNRLFTSHFKRQRIIISFSLFS